MSRTSKSTLLSGLYMNCRAASIKHVARMHGERADAPLFIACQMYFVLNCKKLFVLIIC
jgi:hypothetical protein